MSKHRSLIQDCGRPAFLFCVLLLLCLPATAAPAINDGEVAQLGATRYTAADLGDYVRGLDPDTRSQATADPQLMNRLVQLEIIRKAILAEAKAKNWQRRPEVAKQIGQAGDAVTLKTYLASVVALPVNYPSAADIQKAYDLNRDRFLVPRQYRLEQIFVASPKGDKNAVAAQKTAADLAAKARSGGVKFEDLARSTSQHKPSAAKGGDMGWAAEGQILPQIREKIAGMARYEISPPIHSDAGWHIVRLLDTRPAAVKPLAEVSPLIVQSLRQSRQQQDEQLYIVRMLQKTPVTLDQPLVRKAFEAAR
jgi:peptidylprolyl isomerase